MVSCVYAISVKPNYVGVLPVFRGRPNFEVRAQSFRDEGRFSKMVDANLGVLRERMEEVKMREKLERCFNNTHQHYGWNYAASYDYKIKNTKQFSNFLHFLLVISASLGFTFFTGTFSLCLISFILHFNH